MDNGAKKSKGNMKTYCRLSGHRKLLAGGNWNNGTNCSSQSRNANNYRWNANTNISRRFLADTGKIVMARLLAVANSWLDLTALLTR
jgi:hypothetical protein